ncbi:hypothetical protein AB0G32_16110 [Streptomyces sp. NPDC023723]|uniref:trypsin-like serine peptidase n=1 Tax=Streptomyces sp. NPDC023723 TaxID=3154323 RepID=UPI0033C2559F
MRSIRLSFPGRRPRDGRRGRALAGPAALALALALTGCGSDGGSAGDSAASTAADGSGGFEIPDDVRDRLEEHGIDVDQWQDGAWRDWDRADWLRRARDFVNPVIEDLWDPDRMRDAEELDPEVTAGDLAGDGDAGVTDPEPRPVPARAVPPPYHANAATAGKVFFDAPEGQMVCSATVVADPARPGRSNLVWTAGHCVHAGRTGGWYRNIAFVPSYNDAGRSGAELANATEDEVAPYGVWWGDRARTSDQWIERGGATGGDGAPYDFAVIHVTPEEGGGGRSLEETVGAALPVDFAAPAVSELPDLTAFGYPAAAPFDGQTLFGCEDRPGRLSVDAAEPTMYRVGCTMTGGSSGGGWIAAGADGDPALVSNTSIGPVGAGWLAGPRLGGAARAVYDAVSADAAGDGSQ